MYVKNLNTVYVSVHFSTLQIGKIFDVYIELHNFRTNKNATDTLSYLDFREVTG